MRKSSKKSSLAKWQKFAWASLLVLVVAYHFGRPTLEKVTGLSLPALDGGQSQVAPEDNPTGTSAPNSRQVETGTRFDTSKSTEPQNDGRRGDPELASSDDEFPLKKIGRNKLQTPAGLVYGMGARGEHRIDHVMLHTEDEPGKNVHGVFDSKDKFEVLQMIDDAYERIKKKSRGVKSTKSGDRGDRMEYVVEMDRKTGYEGGKSGKRKNYPDLRKLKIVLQSGNEVITAFPFR
jgi:hypothetical protein